MAKLSPEHKQRLIADSVGVGHLVMANVAIVLGEYTTIFKGLSTAKYPGLDVVFRFFDAPVYLLLKSHIEYQSYSMLSTMLFGEAVIILSSILYGALAYLVVKLFFPFIE